MDSTTLAKALHEAYTRGRYLSPESWEDLIPYEQREWERIAQALLRGEANWWEAK